MGEWKSWFEFDQGPYRKARTNSMASTGHVWIDESATARSLGRSNAHGDQRALHGARAANPAAQPNSTKSWTNGETFIFGRNPKSEPSNCTLTQLLSRCLPIFSNSSVRRSTDQMKIKCNYHVVSFYSFSSVRRRPPYCNGQLRQQVTRP